MSKFYKVDVIYNNWLERVNNLPAWTPEDEGRLLYDRNTKGVYFGDSTAFIGAGAYLDVPLNAILLIDSPTVIPGYTLLTNKDDMVIYITKGSGAGGEAGGSDKLGGTWTFPQHTHDVPLHNHSIPGHQHSISSQGSHQHTYSITTGPGGGGPDKNGGNQRQSKVSHTHLLSGTTGGGGSHDHSGLTGSTGGNTDNKAAYSSSQNAAVSTWRPRGRNFTRQRRS